MAHMGFILGNGREHGNHCLGFRLSSGSQYRNRSTGLYGNSYSPGTTKFKFQASEAGQRAHGFPSRRPRLLPL